MRRPAGTQDKPAVHRFSAPGHLALISAAINLDYQLDHGAAPARPLLHQDR